MAENLTAAPVTVFHSTKNDGPAKFPARVPAAAPVTPPLNEATSMAGVTAPASRARAPDLSEEVGTSMTAATEAVVQQNPWRSTLIGATVGLLAGVLIARTQRA